MTLRQQPRYRIVSSRYPGKHPRRVVVVASHPRRRQASRLDQSIVQGVTRRSIWSTTALFYSIIRTVPSWWICSATGGFKKGLWLLIMLAMASVLLYNVVSLSMKYFIYPISVKYSIDHQEELTFPTIAICNMSPIKKSSLEAAQTVKRRKKRSASSKHTLFCTSISVYIIMNMIS